jgi:hypothetical protein
VPALVQNGEASWSAFLGRHVELFLDGAQTAAGGDDNLQRRHSLLNRAAAST